MNRIAFTALAIVLVGRMAGIAVNAQDDPKQAAQQKVAAFKQALAENQKALRQYTWTENTQLSLKGEVKSTKVEQCRYGADGKVQKTLLSTPPEKKEMRGLKKRVVEKKTDEMKDYMEQVGKLIREYVPPKPELIKADIAGGASLSPLGSDSIQLQFKDFVKSGDLVSITVDSAAKAIRQFKVGSYILDGNEKENVSLDVDFQTLPDGTNFAAKKKLIVTAKQITVDITATDFQKLGQ